MSPLSPLAARPGEHPIRSLLRLYRPYTRRFGAATFWFIIKSSGVWALPILTGAIIAVITDPTHHQLSELWIYGAISFVVFAQNIPTHYLFIKALSGTTRQIGARLRFALTRQLQMLSMSYYFRTKTGALHSKILRDVEIIEQTTIQAFQVLAMATINLLIAVILTSIRAPAFLLFFLLTIPATFLIVRLLNSYIERRNRDLRQTFEHMSANMLEMIRLMPVVRAHGSERFQMQSIRTHVDDAQNAAVRVDAINGVFGAIIWVTFRLFEVLCLITAGYLAYTKILPITVADVVMLTGLFANLTNAVADSLYVLPELTRSFESVHSINEVLGSTELEHNIGKIRLESVKGHFEFRDVSFAYPVTEEGGSSPGHTLSHIDLDIQPGETIAIVGASGAGKSTLLNMVVGLIQPSSGRVLVDGIDMAALDLQGYRQFLSVVSQETLLFSGTVYENITFGLENISPGQVMEAAEAANAREFIDRLPDGLNTVIGERGALLSGGQQQRLSIARALLRDPRVLVLDEPTSALDAESELMVQQALQRLVQGRTTFIVAHRLSTIRNATRIVAMENGRIVEFGTHTELLTHGQVYARLHDLQAAAR